MQLQPVGLGQPRELPTPGLVDFDQEAWSDDGRFIAYQAQTTQNEWNAYLQAVAGGPPILIQTAIRNSFPKPSPDGELVALRLEHGGGIALYRKDGTQMGLLKGAEGAEYLVRFANGGKSVLLAEATGHELALTLVDLADGHRTPWKRVPTDAATGTNFVVTPDLKYYAYVAPRYSSVLYIVSNAR